MHKLLCHFAALAFCWSLAMTALSGEVSSTEWPADDTLVYKNGDRLRGQLVEQTAQIIVFQSERFGLLRVPVGTAVVVKSGQLADDRAIAAGPGLSSAPMTQGAPALPSAQSAAPLGNLNAPATRDEPERRPAGEWFSPAVLAARLANFFGPWHGKLGFGAEVLNNTTAQKKLSLDTTIQRKWKADEVVLKARYDYSKTNDLTTADLIKADALWRHDLAKSRFALYRATFEWNSASFSKTRVPTDYILVQQEIGVGLSIVPTKTRTVRFGLSENIFDTWSLTPIEDHSSYTAESAFLETELKLPWRMTLAQRGVFYYSLASSTDGWEYRIELSKKFSETFSTSIGYEVRRGSPRNGAPDYSRLKLLFGFDF